MASTLAVGARTTFIRTCLPAAVDLKPMLARLCEERRHSAKIPVIEFVVDNSAESGGFFPYVRRFAGWRAKSGPSCPTPTSLPEIERILTDTPELPELVYFDLVRGGIASDKGRDGMSSNQVLPAAIAYHLVAASFEDLAFRLQNSLSYRRFCRIPKPGDAPSAQRFTKTSPRSVPPPGRPSATC